MYGPLPKAVAVRRLGGEHPNKVYASAVRQRLVGLKDGNLFLTKAGTTALGQSKPVVEEEGTVDHPWGKKKLPEYMSDTIGTLPACSTCGSTAGVKRYDGRCAPCEDSYKR
jgi:hypothetical protein